MRVAALSPCKLLYMVAIASDGELVLGSMASLIASPSELFCSDMGDSRSSTVLENAANRFQFDPKARQVVWISGPEKG